MVALLCAEVPLPRRLLLSNGERNGSRRRRRRRLFSFPTFLVPATEATKAQATGRAAPRSRRQQWPLISGKLMVHRIWLSYLKSCHNTGVYNAAKTSTRGTRSSVTCASLVMLSSLHRAAWMMPILLLGFRSCLLQLRTYFCSRCRSRRLTWSVSRRSRRLGSSLHYNVSSREVALLALQLSPRRPLMAQPSMRGDGRGRIAERSRIFA